MVSVGDRVKEAIDWMARGNLAQALSSVSIALDMTAQRHAGTDRSGHAIRKRFIQDYLWLIAHLGFPGGISPTASDPFADHNVKAGAVGTVGAEEIIDHVVRCGLSRSDGKPSKVAWKKAIALGRDEEGNLVLNEGLVWGLVSAVVFAPVNRSESVPEEYWLQVGQFRMFISELWGRVDLAKRIVKFHTGLEVP